MLITDTDRWAEIWVTITRNKTRSLLTCFGVFWGILMLVILLGAGTGLRNAILGQTSDIATNSVFLMTDRTSLPYKGYNRGRSWDMKNRDIESLRYKLPGVKNVAPMIVGSSGNKNVVYGQYSGSFRVKGITTDYYAIEGIDILFGRRLNQVDINEKRKVCTIGEDINKVLFKNGDPCGKYIRVNGLYYQVVGVTKAKSDMISINGNSDKSVYIPFFTLQQSLNIGETVHLTAINIHEDYPVEMVIKQAKQILFQQNEIAPDDPQALSVINLADMFHKFFLLFMGIDALIWLVGIGTLLAGIIGVSNIMLVTVRERTKEIGVRRALGAKPIDIISQIMSESLLLTAMAGLIGLSCGVYLLDFINKMIVNMPQDDIMIKDPGVNIQTAIIATVIMLIFGLLAGLIPAWRALQIKAIDALRDE